METDLQEAKVRRPLLRYHGGKWMLAPWIIAHFPLHRVYVEPFGGAASVLLRKPRSYGEVYNDLDGEIVNLFRMARERGQELVRLLELTPFARAEYRESFLVSKDPLEQARRTLIRSYMGFGSNSLNRKVKSGFRANANRSGTTAAHDWSHFPESLKAIIERLRGVCLENKPAMSIMRQHDSGETLHYVDPPYVHSTRSARGDGRVLGYAHEMSDEQHEALGADLKTLSGKVVLSGYRCELYDRLFADWRRMERKALADGARPRLECLWLNF